MLRLKMANEEKAERTQQISEIRNELAEEKEQRFKETVIANEQKLFGLQDRKRAEAEMK